MAMTVGSVTRHVRRTRATPERGGRRLWLAAQGPRARTCLDRRGGGDVAGAAARASQARAAVPGRTEAVTAPGGA